MGVRQKGERRAAGALLLVLQGLGRAEEDDGLAPLVAHVQLVHPAPVLCRRQCDLSVDGAELFHDPGVALVVQPGKGEKQDRGSPVLGLHDPVGGARFGHDEGWQKRLQDRHFGNRRESVAFPPAPYEPTGESRIGDEAEAVRENGHAGSPRRQLLGALGTERDLSARGVVLGVRRQVQTPPRCEIIAAHVGIPHSTHQQRSGGNAYFHAEREHASARLDGPEPPRRLLHPQRRLQARSGSLGKEEGHGIAAEAEHVAPLLAGDAHHGGEEIVEDAGELLGALLADLRQAFGEGGEAGHIGEQGTALDPRALGVALEHSPEGSGQERCELPPEDLVCHGDSAEWDHGSTPRVESTPDTVYYGRTLEVVP